MPDFWLCAPWKEVCEVRHPNNDVFIIFWTKTSLWDHWLPFVYSIILIGAPLLQEFSLKWLKIIYEPKWLIWLKISYLTQIDLCDSKWLMTHNDTREWNDSPGLIVTSITHDSGYKQNSKISKYPAYIHDSLLEMWAQHDSCEWHNSPWLIVT